MKTAPFATICASALVTIATASKYNAVCIFDELKCSGSIQLREYTPDSGNKCEAGDCAAITAPGVSTFSMLPTCTDDHIADTEKHLKGKPYVIVENYATSGCAGDFTKAVAVVASGKCYPSRTGDMSYQVTLGANDLSVKWMQFSGGNCSSNATEVSFKATDVDRKTCVDNKMKVLAVKPSSASSSSTEKPSSSMTGSPVPTPSPTSSASATGCAAAVLAAGLVMATMLA